MVGPRAIADTNDSAAISSITSPRGILGTGGRSVPTLPITVPVELVAEFCRLNHIRKLSLFGSVLTPRFRADSDVDVLVDFDPDHIPSLFDVVRMERELSEVFGKKVDLRTPEDLSRYFREQVVASALLQYESP